MFLTSLTQSFKHSLCYSRGLWLYQYDLSLSLSDTHSLTVSLCPALSLSPSPPPLPLCALTRSLSLSFAVLRGSLWNVICDPLLSARWDECTPRLSTSPSAPFTWHSRSSRGSATKVVSKHGSVLPLYHAMNIKSSTSTSTMHVRIGMHVHRTSSSVTLDRPSVYLYFKKL